MKKSKKYFYMNTARKTALWSPLLLTLIGCSFPYDQEGAIDYRKASMPELVCTGIEPAVIEPAGGDRTPHIAKLQSKNLPSGGTEFSPAKGGESLLIRLVSAYIENYTEGPFSYLADATKGQFRHRGEIAIIVDAIPLKGDKNDTMKSSISFNFSDENQGKVVFYSNDVVAGQFLNFNNMPIYGPSSDPHHGIGLEIRIMEMDTRDPIVTSLLKTIARYGAKPLIFASAGNQILSSLSNDVKNAGKNNDINFLYRLLLEPKNGAMHAHPAIETGYYVFIRVHDTTSKSARKDDIDWSKLVFDVNSGRLYEEVEDNNAPETAVKCTINPDNNGSKTDNNGSKTDNNAPKTYTAYKKRNYLVIRIDKDTSGRDLAVENQMYKDFISATQTSSINSFVQTFNLNKFYNLLREIEKHKSNKSIVINKFTSHWNSYIAPSLEKYFGSAEKVNATDLNIPQLIGIANSLLEKINVVSEKNNQCVDKYFRWFDPVLEKEIKGEKEIPAKLIVKKIQEGINRYITCRLLTE